MTTEPKYWFRARRFGWGWGLPLTWQGWLTFFIYLAFAILAMVFLPSERYGARFFGAVLIAITLLLVAVCWLKGEPLRWRWGRADRDG